MQSVLLGCKGMGKSTLGLSLARSSRRRLIVDPRNEHSGHYHFESLREMLDFFKAGEPPPQTDIVYSPLKDSADYSRQLFDFLSAFRGYSIFVDEVDQFCTAQTINPGLKRLLNYQRHFGIALILSARRPAAVHRDVTALADVIYFFHTHENNDLRYVQNLCGTDFAMALRSLKCGQYKTQYFPAR